MFRTALRSSVLRNNTVALSTLGLRNISLKPNFSKLKLIPPPPGGVNGTVNDKLKPPVPDYFHGSYHWDYERITAVSLIPLTMVPLYAALSSGTIYPMLDSALCSVLLIHAQIGFTSCIVDYIPRRKYGVWHTLAMSALYMGSTLGLYGIYELETSNNGLVDLISKIWKDDDSNLYVFGRH